MFIIILLLILTSKVESVDVERYFITTETTLPSGMQEILDYYDATSTDIKITKYTTDPLISDTNLNETIIKFKQDHPKEDMLFAYLPKANMTLLNIIAEEQNIYVWNAVNTAVEVCYSRIILGYYTTRSSLRCIYS